MKRGQLSEFFKGQAAKRLSAVEADTGRSNQREFNGVAQLAGILGPSIPRRTIPARFVYLDDDEDRVLNASGRVTWYDAREHNPTRSEDRLYFTQTSVSDHFRVGDLLVIGVRPDESLMIMVAARGSTAAQQLLWLFGFGEVDADGFDVRDEGASDNIHLNYASRQLLEYLGIDATELEESRLEEMLARFGNDFPRTREFSDYARSTVPDVSALGDPDIALVTWMEREEVLFRTLERHFVSNRLKEGFAADDVDGFIGYSLSVQNRRKSRAGSALQNHVQRILDARSIPYAPQARTENRSTTDFLFPGSTEYRDPGFPVAGLAMLGVKSTCKDRWRQVLAEAQRVPRKHLLTLEPGITVGQTDEMRANNLQLIVPSPLQASYPPENADWLWSLASFFEYVTSIGQTRG